MTSQPQITCPKCGAPQQAIIGSGSFTVGKMTTTCPNGHRYEAVPGEYVSPQGGRIVVRGA